MCVCACVRVCEFEMQTDRSEVFPTDLRGQICWKNVADILEILLHISL